MVERNGRKVMVEKEWSKRNGRKGMVKRNGRKGMVEKEWLSIQLRKKKFFVQK